MNGLPVTGNCVPHPDATTCRLIMERFKFKPARNAAGQAISAEIEYEQEWDAPPPLPADPGER